MTITEEQYNEAYRKFVDSNYEDRNAALIVAEWIKYLRRKNRKTINSILRGADNA